MARMLGKTRPKANCLVPGHGDRCSVAAELKERSVGRAAEKRAWSREAWSLDEVLDHFGVTRQELAA